MLTPLFEAIISHAFHTFSKALSIRGVPIECNIILTRKEDLYFSKKKRKYVILYNI